jgi:hypothetical protein
MKLLGESTLTPAEASRSGAADWGANKLALANPAHAGIRMFQDVRMRASSCLAQCFR